MDDANLAMLIELAATSRDAAAARRAQAAAGLAQAQEQLEVLRGYARDYERRAQTTLTQGTDIAAQNNLRAFTARLQRAIEAQRLEVERRAAALATAEDELRQMYRRVKSLQALAERRRAQTRQKLARREQKALDEIAQAARERPLSASEW
jgi:flagellar export protein FliJ